MTEHELSNLTEDQLRALMNEIQSELTARDKQRKDEATQRIKAMADAVGLSVSVKEKNAKKRGRPSKAGAATKSDQ